MKFNLINDKDALYKYMHMKNVYYSEKDNVYFNTKMGRKYENYIYSVTEYKNWR